MIQTPELTRQDKADWLGPAIVYLNEMYIADCSGLKGSFTLAKFVSETVGNLAPLPCLPWPPLVA
jgi:hypothetical protein